VPSEMISGPDLGGGFLHQLTIDRSEDRTTFTFHAQDGGSDAGGPPPGPLDVFGFVHPPSPCPFGGPRCWHRRFLLPFLEAPKVRLAYNRNRFVLEAMLAQIYQSAPVRVEDALAALVERLGEPGPGIAPPWYVGGSTAAWLLGAELVPRDIDLGTTREGVDRIAALLGDYLIEPLATTDGSGGRIVRGARAFVGTFREGARVEWCHPLEMEAEDPEWSIRIEQVRRVPVTFRGRQVEVTRPEYALVRAVGHGRTDRIPTLVATARRLGIDHALLDELLRRWKVPAKASEALAARLEE